MSKRLCTNNGPCESKKLKKDSSFCEGGDPTCIYSLHVEQIQECDNCKVWKNKYFNLVKEIKEILK